MKHPSYLSLFLIAAPAIVGGFAVLAIAAVGWGVWLTHLLAIGVACFLVLIGNSLDKRASRQVVVSTIIVITLAALATLLIGNSSGPERWMPIGPLKLYLAPFLLPSFIVACSLFAGKNDKHQPIIFIAFLSVAALLAIQPDASQVLGLLVAACVVFVRYRSGAFRSVIVVLLLILMTLWAFSQPDPLEPVPYVEGVFALAFEYSFLAGLALMVSVTVLIVGLWLQSVKGPSWLSAVAVYYVMLFVCSTAGLTPAPLIGYGAGPILGFGLMIAVSRDLHSEVH